MMIRMWIETNSTLHHTTNLKSSVTTVIKKRHYKNEWQSTTQSAQSINQEKIFSTQSKNQKKDFDFST